MTRWCLGVSQSLVVLFRHHYPHHRHRPCRFRLRPSLTAALCQYRRPGSQVQRCQSQHSAMRSPILKTTQRRNAWCILSDGVGVDGKMRKIQKRRKKSKKNWSHRESNTGRSRILVGLTKPDEPQATVIPLHYRTDAGIERTRYIYFQTKYERERQLGIEAI